MAQHKPKEIVFCDNKRRYYCYDEELYTATFPQEWVLNQLAGTGPKDCKKCHWYGSWNGVFIGYCVTCAKMYKGERGRGFIGFADETTLEEAKQIPSAYSTYLKDVDLDEIGDKDFMDSAALLEEINNYTNPNYRSDYDY